ncbi:hypothetical protein HD806DRAFT_353394 [Xylariaceae sp. AK1471]|nr:hypothetical protein HD806DRAFT_353394 [Xylariaceae sp. AK1471]
MKSMFFSIAALAAFVSAVNGDSTSTAATTTTECQAQGILDACLETTQGYLSLCESQDWGCLCDKYTAIMTCFANCPNDSRRYSIDSQRQLYCSNASAYPSSTSAPGKKTSSKSASSETHVTATPTAEETETGYPTYEASSTNAQALSTAGAVDMVGYGNGAGVLAAFAGVAAALL